MKISNIVFLKDTIYTKYLVNIARNRTAFSCTTKNNNSYGNYFINDKQRSIECKRYFYAHKIGIDSVSTIYEQKKDGLFLPKHPTKMFKKGKMSYESSDDFEMHKTIIKKDYYNK